MEQNKDKCKKSCKQKKFKCNQCQYYDKGSNICQNGNDCYKINYTTCTDFIINEKLIMF